MQQSNRRIAVNTAIIYMKMIIVTVVGLFTTRYVLLALGISDYGLYNVLGGILAILNIVSIAMYTTTRRYINVEAGKKEKENEIFNTCLVIHIAFALITFLLAETIGMFYILNYLIIDEGKLGDAVFVFQISTIVSIIGLINVPYQALHNAYEKFNVIAGIEILQSLLKIPLIIVLILFQGNSLRVYAIGICLINMASFISYIVSCHAYYPKIIKLKRYFNKKLIKEILWFNIYTTTGATVIVLKKNGSQMVVNFFFGTLVNGAYALAYQVETYVNMLVSNLSMVSAPQITQSYIVGDFNRVQKLVENVTRYTILIMIILVSVIGCNLNFILTLWLSKVPDYAFVLCQWVLLSLLLQSFDNNINTLIFAYGKLKIFTIVSSFLGIASLPVLYMLLKWGCPPETAIIVFLSVNVINKVVNLVIVSKVTNLNIRHYLYSVYIRIFGVLCVCIIFYCLRRCIIIDDIWGHMISVLLSLFVAIFVCITIGLNKKERQMINMRVKYLFIK